MVTKNVKSKIKQKKVRAVLICTEYRGVFFAYTDAKLDSVIATVTGMRNCISWDVAIGGVFGLVEKGPTSGCKIGMKVTGKSVIHKITYMAEVTKASQEAWESAPCVK